MIEVKNLTKQYGKIKAVDNISFSIKPGEVVGFLGPNGAGKTTTMSMMTGFISATKGEITIDGIDVTAEPERAKKQIGYLPDTPPVYLDLKVKEYLNFAAEIKGVKGKERNLAVQYVMEQTSIADIPGRLIKNLSRGYKQRVGLAQAMLGNPKVIIMDEPTIGLDPKQILEMRDVIKNLGTKHTVILSSHIMQEVSAVCDRVMIINKGKIVAEGTPESLSGEINKGANNIHLKIKGTKAAIMQAIAPFEEIEAEEETITAHDNIVNITLFNNDGIDIRETIFNCMAKNDLPILLMKPAEMSLEDIFLSVTSSDRIDVTAFDNLQKEEVPDDDSDL